MWTSPVDGCSKTNTFFYTLLPTVGTETTIKHDVKRYDSRTRCSIKLRARVGRCAVWPSFLSSLIAPLLIFDPCRLSLSSQTIQARSRLFSDSNSLCLLRTSLHNCLIGTSHQRVLVLDKFALPSSGSMAFTTCSIWLNRQLRDDAKTHDWQMVVVESRAL